MICLIRSEEFNGVVKAIRQFWLDGSLLAADDAFDAERTRERRVVFERVLVMEEYLVFSNPQGTSLDRGC